MTYKFEWKCSYMCSWYYIVYGDGKSYEIEVRNGFNDYERSISNYNDDEWGKWVVPTLNMMRRNDCNPHKPIPKAVVDAFNQWRAQKHADAMEEMKGNPQRFGEIDDADFPPPAHVGAILYTPEGWQQIA